MIVGNMSTPHRKMHQSSRPSAVIDKHEVGFNLPAAKKLKTLQLLDAGCNLVGDSMPGNEDNQTRECSSASDSESGICGSSSEERFELMYDNSLVRIHEEDRMFSVVKNQLVSSLNSLGVVTEVVDICRNVYSGFLKQAKLQSFQIFSRALENKNKGEANVRYAWYGGSKEEIHKIISQGFGPSVNNGVYGQGIYLSPMDYPLGSMESSVVGADGLRHLLLCRVLLGRTEVVPPRSGQCSPSSEEYDSGVDSLRSRRKYIVWSCHMNTHILPEYIVSYKLSDIKGGQILNPRLPTTSFIPFPVLMQELTRVLPPDAIKLMAKLHSDHKERKITRQELIRQVRIIAGDKVLNELITMYREKNYESFLTATKEIDLLFLSGNEQTIEPVTLPDQIGWDTVSL